MHFKNICLTCRKSFNQNTELGNIIASNCPQCGKKMIEVDQKFKPPKNSDLKSWKTVSFLIEHGFYYQRIYDSDYQILYPENLKEAKEFVIKYSNQALK